MDGPKVRIGRFLELGLGIRISDGVGDLNYRGQHIRMKDLFRVEAHYGVTFCSGSHTLALNGWSRVEIPDGMNFDPVKCVKET